MGVEKAPAVAQCLAEERQLRDEVDRGAAAAAAVMAHEQAVLDGLATELRATRAKQAAEMDSVELEALCNELQYENAMLAAEDNHSRRVIRELLEATRGVKADVTYTLPRPSGGAPDIQERLTFRSKEVLDEVGARQPGMPSSSEVDWLQEVVAVQKAYLEALSAQYNREEALMRGMKADDAAVGAEVASRMADVGGSLGGRAAAVEERVKEVGRLLNAEHAHAAPRIAELERGVQTLEYELRCTRDVLERETASHAADVEALLHRAVAALGSKGAGKEALDTQRSELVTHERVLAQQKQCIAAEDAARERRLRSLKKRLVSVDAKHRALAEERAKLKTPHVELGTIKHALRDAEGRMWLSGAARSAGRMAKHVRRSVSTQQRLHDPPKEAAMVFT